MQINLCFVKRRGKNIAGCIKRANQVQGTRLEQLSALRGKRQSKKVTQSVWMPTKCFRCTRSNFKYV